MAVAICPIGVYNIIRFTHFVAHQKKALAFASAFFNSIRLRRVILLRSYIRLTPSCIAFCVKTVCKSLKERPIRDIIE